MEINRRNFLKFAGLTGGSLAVAGVAGKSLAAATGSGGAAAQKDGKEFCGMLVDTTKCIGCRSCEEACNEANKLPKPAESFSSESVFEKKRDTTPEAFTVVNRFPNAKEPDKPVFVRRQCMHCNQPGCASACLCRAMEKIAEGPIIYNKDRCMGCRYCMIACPFDIPKFEYDKAAPYVKKCIFCASKVKAGEKPACADACPEGATIFGTRRELLEEAKTRVYQNKDRYHPHIYGESEVGGTGWLMISSLPPEQVGLKTNLGTKSIPEHTSGFLFSVPHVDILWPAVMFGFNYLINGDKHEGGAHGE